MCVFLTPFLNAWIPPGYQPGRMVCIPREFDQVNYTVHTREQPKKMNEFMIFFLCDFQSAMLRNTSNELAGARSIASFNTFNG